MRQCAVLWVVLCLSLALVSCNASREEVSRTPSQETARVTQDVHVQPGQPLDDFLNDASLQVVLRFPATITQLGISNWIGVRDDTLAPLTRAYELDTIALIESLLAQLYQYDLERADPSVALSARVYGWYLEDLLESHRFSDHTYPVNTHLSNYTGFLERLMGRYHPLQTLANAEDYLSRLEQIEPRIDELIDRLDDSAAIGALPPVFILAKAADELRRVADAPARDSIYYTSFRDRLRDVAIIPPDRQQDMVDTARSIVETSVLPAYKQLAIKAGELATQSPPEAGVWRHEGGDEYYAYRLRKYTTTDLTAQEIHEIGLQEVARIQKEIDEVAAGLGLDHIDGYAALFEHLTETYGTASGEEAIVRCETLISEVSERVRSAFSRWPAGQIEVVGGNTHAFFVPGPLDGSRPGLFYAPVGRNEPIHSLYTLVCHEAIPGHGLQTLFAQSANLPTYRAGLGISAYAEGWALYAERLVWEMGLYQGNPAGNLGRLQAELWRAVRLVVDTGIHAFQWSYDRAVSYMLENTGIDEPLVRQEVERYIVAPGQACAYKIGMIEMLRQRQRAREALGDTFSLPAFHDAILGNGDVPLYMLEGLVDTYIDASTQ